MNTYVKQTEKEGGEEHNEHGASRARGRGTSMKYPPTPLDAQAVRCARAKASEGYPPVAKSAEAAIPGSGLVQIPLTHSSTGKARGFLRRRIKGTRTLG